MDRTRLTGPLASSVIASGAKQSRLRYVGLLRRCAPRNRRARRKEMPKQKRSDDWGFPRWRSYGDKGRQAAKVRLCDRVGCSEVGDRPAPKAPHGKDRWYFCEAHAAEYNKNWNYFAGLSPEEAARRAAEEE